MGKIQAADGLLITALSCGASASGAAGAYRPEQFGKGFSGFMIFDIASDPVHPRLLGRWDNGVPGGTNGVHRFFYNGGPYVHVSSDCRGFEGMIYRIVDIQDPASPREVGRWWLPEQFADGYAGREFDPLCPPQSRVYEKKAWLHGPPYVRDGIAYCGYSGAGLVILDVRDVTRPRMLGQLPLCPPFASHYAGAKTHTALPLPGRDFLVATNEGERFPWFTKEKLGGMPQSLNNLHMVDIRDPAHPTLIAEFPYPEVPEGFPYPNFNDMGLGCPGPFGPHNIHEPMSNKPWLEQRGDRVYCCYFHAGLRVYDVSDPYYIKEIGYFIPPNPLRHRISTNTGPCIAVDRGLRGGRPGKHLHGHLSGRPLYPAGTGTAPRTRSSHRLIPDKRQPACTGIPVQAGCPALRVRNQTALCAYIRPSTRGRKRIKSSKALIRKRSTISTIK